MVGSMRVLTNVPLTETGRGERVEERWLDLQRQWHGRSHPPGRNDLPAALFDLHSDGVFDGEPDLLAHAVTDAWTSAEWPARNVDSSQWQEWFDETGWIVDGVRVGRLPTLPTALYRAALLVEDGDECGTDEGLSWTDSVERARWFHERNKSFAESIPGSTAVLLRIDDPSPGSILARFEEARGESEWTLCTDLEDVVRVDAESLEWLESVR